MQPELMGRRSLHDGAVDDRLDVVLSVPRVDDALPLGVLLDVALCKQLEAHVRGHRLRTKQGEKKQRLRGCFSAVEVEPDVCKVAAKSGTLLALVP